jgi:hypothetical protein
MNYRRRGGCYVGSLPDTSVCQKAEPDIGQLLKSTASLVLNMPAVIADESQSHVVA